MLRSSRATPGRTGGGWGIYNGGGCGSCRVMNLASTSVIALLVVAAGRSAVWISLLLLGAAIILAAFGLRALGRKVRRPPGDDAQAFTLEELRQLRRDGQLTGEQLARATAVVAGRAKDADAKPADHDADRAAADDAEGAGDDGRTPATGTPPTSDKAAEPEQQDRGA